jgi:hypothetical protein
VLLSRLPVLALLALLVAPARAWAKPWNGIQPGTDSSEEVIDRFGQPSRTLTTGDQQTLVYSGEKAVKGTVQSQFKVGPDRVVRRIDVYPAVVLDAAAIEASYGPACTAKDPVEPCYVKKESASSGRPYHVYARLGLAVFFKEDGVTVQSLSFLPGA